jgi:hypothetical protein
MKMTIANKVAFNNLPSAVQNAVKNATVDQVKKGNIQSGSWMIQFKSKNAGQYTATAYHKNHGTTNNIALYIGVK